MTEPRHKTRPEKPNNVRRFAWLWTASIVIAFIGVPFTPEPSSPDLLKFGITRVVLMIFEVFSMTVIIALMLPFFWLAVWRGRNWARWVLFIAFAVTTPLFFVTPKVFDPENLPQTGVELVSLIVEAAAFYFLFTGDARSWFKREHSS
jgi:hypothetical protein